MNDASVYGPRSRREALGLGAMSGAGLAFARSLLRPNSAQAAPTDTFGTRSEEFLQSAGVMAFGPENVLFVGGVQMLIPGQGFRDIYNHFNNRVGALAAGFMNVVFKF